VGLLGAAVAVWHRPSLLTRRLYLAPEPARHAHEYPQSLQKISTERKRLKTLLHQGKLTTSHLGVVFTHLMLTEVFPFWYGTPWAFSGTSEAPQSGQIACGYFVTTTLRDAGLPIERVKLAQAASETMIRQLVDKRWISHHSNRPLTEFSTDLTKAGSGLYIIGLDNHTGFIAVSSNEQWLIHSSGAYPFCVVKERVVEADILAASNYRVLGKISADKALLRRWLG
jgi:hypothetical protein